MANDGGLEGRVAALEAEVKRLQVILDGLRQLGTQTLQSIGQALGAVNAE